ncbi:NAD-dependent histone deacetylase sir2 [Pleurotus pulmonarius]|nr:NAD-dependent histone deacetylase sir2 [Pleurotus pulmonarius]KAF4594034.1 NAD-dependent histone deacetylase sir2 [Pleurotus pulmonarius]
MSLSSAPTPLPSATPSRSNSERTTPSNNADELLASQIRAFITASEDVDIDVETIEDLMKVFPDSASRGEHGSDKSEVDVDIDTNDDELEIDMSALFASRDRALETWSAQEIRMMMRHLKEHGMQSWLDEYVHVRKYSIPNLLNAFGINLCPELANLNEKAMIYFLKVAMSRELRLREKLPQYNTVDDAVKLIQSSRRIIILTGAGISVSCGIPDFRSRDGLYASLKDYDLDDPQQMFDINYFRENPSISFLNLSAVEKALANRFCSTSSFASQIYPSNFVPSPCHKFIKLVEDRGKLLRNYTQNIDTLETLAGVKNVLQCHGSFATATCIQCHTRVPGSAIEADIMKRRVPLCRMCNPSADSSAKSSPSQTPKKAKAKHRSKKKQRGEWDSQDEDNSDDPEYPPGIMKPDITFFGEKLTSDFDHSLEADRSQVDLLLVIGTSLKVAPVADILCHLPHSVPQILINKTPIKHINPDVILLGDADAIVHHICQKLGWDLSPSSSPSPSSSAMAPPRGNGNLKKRSMPDLPSHQEPQRVGNSHVWLFSGAEGGKWLDDRKAQWAAGATNESTLHAQPREAKKPRTQ